LLMTEYTPSLHQINPWLSLREGQHHE